MSSFSNLKQFLRIFPGNENEIKEYVRTNHLKTDKRADLVKLIDYCNEIIRKNR